MLFFKNYKLKMSEEMGRGLYACENIDRGSLISQCEILLLSPADTVKVNETELQFYTFKFDQTQDCLVLGDGEIFNHSDDANVSYKLEDFDGRKVMRFYATQTIPVGEQLFIDYSADVKDLDVSGHISNPSLVG